MQSFIKIWKLVRPCSIEYQYSWAAAARPCSIEYQYFCPAAAKMKGNSVLNRQAAVMNY